MAARKRASMATRILAGSLLLTLTLAPLAPVFARPAAMVHCMPNAATVDAGNTSAMPCHAGDMSACTHALTCIVGSAAVLPAQMQLRLVQGRLEQPLGLAAPRYERLGFKPPTPPPNR
jgi:hypothetical protein